MFCNILCHPCSLLIPISTSLPLLPSRVWRDLDVAPCNWKADDIRCSLMFTYVHCACTLDIDSRKNWALGLIKGTSASFNFAKAQTWARNMETWPAIKHIEGFEIFCTFHIFHFRKLRPELCWPYPDPQTHAPQPESMSKKLRFLLTFFTGLGQRLKNKLSENLSLSNSHSTRLDQFTSPMTKEGNYGPCWLATVVHLAIPARYNRNNTSRTVKVCESTPRLYEEF